MNASSIDHPHGRNQNIILIHLFLPHAVKEFLEKCKSEFEEKWNHPKHVSLIFVFSLFQFKTS